MICILQQGVVVVRRVLRQVADSAHLYMIETDRKQVAAVCQSGGSVRLTDETRPDEPDTVLAIDALCGRFNVAQSVRYGVEILSVEPLSGVAEILIPPDLSVLSPVAE